jgi:hypothetical protein
VIGCGLLYMVTSRGYARGTAPYADAIPTR